jgi:ubiquinone/menaquinone biosynthesis C-methylase UbiE
MPRYQEIYCQHADRYERLIAREDYKGNLWRTMQPLLPGVDLSIVDMGAGTGRFARLLAPVTREMVCLDLSVHMLTSARRMIPEAEGPDCSFIIADNRSIPLRAGSFDLALAGWSFGHATGWYPQTWQVHIRRAVDELLRLARPGGIAMIFETLGAGTSQPGAPNQALEEYYHYLERERGFLSAQIRTDYRFTSNLEAEELIRFFFGDALGDRVREEGWIVVPEWTGLWWRRL